MIKSGHVEEEQEENEEEDVDSAISESDTEDEDDYNHGIKTLTDELIYQLSNH